MVKNVFHLKGGYTGSRFGFSVNAASSHGTGGL
jgi:hypothetical protein